MAEQAIPRDLYITHVDKDGPLIRIYAQTDKKNALYIERMLYLMRETLDTADLKPKTRNDIKLGLICCAKFEDGVYYRARIIDTTYLHDYKITVFFIDHGNVAYVHVTDIKLLDKLKAVSGTDMGATKLMELGGLAEAFYLGGVAPKCNNQWDDDTVEILRQALCNKDGLCTIHIVGEDKILNFCIPDADPAKLLISSNKGLPLPQQHLEDYLRTIRASKVRNTKTQSPIPQHINTSLPPPRLPSVVQPLPQARFPNLSQPPPARISNETIVKSVPNQNITSRHGGVHVRPGIPGMQIRRSESSISSPASGLQFSTDLLTPGVTHRVFVSHVEDGPCAFAVQLQNVVEEVLSKMMLDLSNIQPQPITAPLNPGSICIGRYSGDKTLCRAIVMNVMDDKVKLYFADFGSSEVLPFSEVYQIPAQFVTPKVMSHRFTLANIKNVVYSEQEKKMFKDLVANARDLMLTVTPPEANPLKQYCELYLHCKNIKTIMEELSQAQQAYIRYQPVSAPLKGSQEKVFVSYVVNPGRFFVQLDKNDYSLKQVMKYVSDHCTRAPHVPLSNQRPGEPCCALFDDGIWYRAEIIKLTTDNKAFINFVDFGNEEEIDLTNLRQISPELVKSLKAQAVLCSLTGYENRYNVDEEISNRLEELVLEHKLIMHVEDCVEMPGQLKKLIVKLIDSRGVDISSQLEVKPTYTTPTSSEYADGGWEDKQATSPQNNNSWGQRFSKSGKGQTQERKDWQQAPNKRYRDEKKPWRSREDGETGAKFNRDENRSGRFNRDEESSGRFNRDRGGSNRFGDDDKGGKFNRDSDSRGGGRFNDDRGERSNTEGGSGRFNRDSDSKGGRFNEEKGTKFSKSDDDKSPWRKKDDDSTSGIKSKREDAGGWKPRGDRESGGGWKSREEGGGSGGWKSREEGGGGGGWKSRDEGSGGGSWKSREEGGGGGGWKSREEGSGGGGGWKSREEGGGGGGWKSRGEGGGGGGGWKSREDGGGGGGWKSREEGGGGGGWKSREEGGGGGGWKSREEGGGGGGWKSREEGGGGWKSREGGGGGWKSREEGGGSGGWKSREEGGGGGGWKSRDGNRFDGERRGGFNRDSDSRSSYRKPWDSKGDGSASKSPKPDTVGGMPHSPVKVGQTDTVEVCFTTSPLNFYIQLSNTFEELTQLMDKIATGCDSGDISDMTDVQEKSGCLAKYSEDDSWYRAVVLEKTFDSVKVLFVDYGNEESVTLDKIKTLPEDMSTLSVQAIKCRLLGVPETAEAEPFKALAEGKPLKAQFVSRNFLSKSFEVVLVDEETNTNINIVMGASEESVQSSLSKMGSLVPIPLKYPVGTTINTQMTWYLSPSQFYLQPMTSNPEFRAMMQAMQAVVRSGTIKQNNDLNIGDFVIARFKADKVLYRAVVQECGFVPKVQYVDYGNVEVVDSGSVWAMEQEYATLPIQAINCCLAGVQPTGETWPSPNSTALDSHFEAETLDCSVLKELDGEGGQQYLVKLVKQGDDVAQKIIEAGLAVAGRDAVGALSELDTSLIVGQTLPVTFLRVQEDYTLYVQPASEEVELQSLELEAGQGVKCVLSNVKETATDEAREALTQLPGNTYIILLVDAVQSEGLQVTLFDGEGQLLALQENEVQSVEKVCPMPILNMHQKVWIAHASEDGIFLHKVMFADLLAELLQKLYDFYNESEPVEQEWSNGNLCCAKSVSDEQWYRAKILETGEETKVQYIDYGNTEIIPINNLRQLDASFYTPHALALLVSLHVTWTVPVENLMELAGETEYNAVILRNKTGWIAEFVDNSGQSLTEKLVELGFATALENSPFKRIVEGGRFAEGSVIPITVSFVDSPLQLWIHVGDDIELIEALQDRLQEAASKLLPLKEATGIFAAKFSDGLWYRALKLDDTSVRFIDYGNSDVVDMTDIKALSPDFLDPAEGYAVKVELPVVDFEEGTNEKLEDLLISSEIDKEEEVIARILSVKENSIVADIIKGGKSVVDILVEENLATKVQKVLTGFVSNFNHLSDFFIQEVGCEENLEMTVNALTNAETFEPVSEVNENDLIAALYSDDGLWYRAKVIKQTENGTEVLFIDYGNSSISSEFRTLPPELAGKPALSKNCALQLPEGLEEWPKSANEKFMEISAEGCTQFDIKVITEGDPDVVSLHYNGNCVSEELKTFIDLIVTESTKTESASVGLTGYDKLVYISHINSPNDFYVQEDGAEIELDTLREVLTDVTSFESLEKITDDLKDKLFGALFVDDELWYRAKVMNHTSDGTEVLFVDYGNSAIASRFVKLPDTLEGKAPVALHCTLGEEDWSVEAKSCFVELGGEGTVPFGMKILKDSDPKLVSLATEGMIVKQKLLSFVNVEINENTAEVTSLSTELPANSEEENIIKTVFVIHVNSPNDFFLHTAEATQLLADISERLLAAEEFPLIEEESISKDKIVAAQFDEDDLWYRAKILDHKENETKVIFIDYGNSVNVAKVKELPDDLLKIPALAMNCALFKPGDGEWDSMASCETFNKLANEDGVSFDLKIVTEGEPNLVSLYINGESVAEQLIVASGMSPVKAITKEDEVDGSAEEKDKMVEDDDPLKQSEIENMLVNYVDGKISEKTHNEMKEVIEDIIYKSTMGPQEDVQQIVEDLISSAASSNLDDTAVAAEPEVDNVESLEIQEDNGECEKINEENEIKKDKVVDNSKSEKVQENNHEVSNSSHISNGVCEDQIKEQDDDRLTEDSNETTDNKSESESKGKKSPSTPRRHNVDDHIVPGCISSVKLNDSSEK